MITKKIISRVRKLNLELKKVDLLIFLLAALLFLTTAGHNERKKTIKLIK